MADKIFEIKVISPDREFYAGKVEMAEFNTTEGYLGVLKGYSPTTVIIAPGELVLHEEVIARKAVIHSGFAQITQDNVTILAEIAEWPEEIDAARARLARDRAEQRLKEGGTTLDVARAQAALQRALARLSVCE